jgi:hypothetical protein
MMSIHILLYTIIHYNLNHHMSSIADQTGHQIEIEVLTHQEELLGQDVSEGPDVVL